MRREGQSAGTIIQTICPPDPRSETPNPIEVYPIVPSLLRFLRSLLFKPNLFLTSSMFSVQC
jgi:hypothetical protein